jgi:hypothetical protein
VHAERTVGGRRLLLWLSAHGIHSHRAHHQLTLLLSLSIESHAALLWQQCNVGNQPVSRLQSARPCCAPGVLVPGVDMAGEPKIL